MSIISNIVNTIRNAVYAKDVREAIASGFEEVNRIAETKVIYRHRNVWQEDEEYVVDSEYIDLVQYNGSTYIALVSHTSTAENAPGDENTWALFAEKGEAVLDDTGWVNVSIGNETVSEVGPYNEDSWPEVRKIGKIVQLRGLVTPLEGYEGRYSLYLTKVLEEKYRPSKTFTSIQQGGYGYKYLLSVRNDGSISIERYTDGNSSEIEIPAEAWLHCNTMWFVD